MRARFTAGSLATLAFFGCSSDVLVVPPPCYPLMSGPQPGGDLPAATTEVTLRMHTDRPAVCRYSPTEGMPYPILEYPFEQTGGTDHASTLERLTPGTYHFYAKCEVPGTGCRTPHDLIFIFEIVRG